MSCALTQGYTVDCTDSVGGIKEIKVGTFGTHAVVASTGTAAAVSSLTTSGWYTYGMRPETGNFDEPESGDDAAGTRFYEPVVNIVVSKLSTTMRNELRLLAQNRLMVAVADQNGKYWLTGWCNGLTKKGSAKTGKAMNEMNGYEIALTGKENLPMLEISSAIYATLVP